MSRKMSTSSASKDEPAKQVKSAIRLKSSSKSHVAFKKEQMLYILTTPLLSQEYSD
ncbi:hypothetical protein RchiOBHm_Chr4g0416701 [Rosa chinensis]|uniref:Uncharacterized protein n=1 Tax=Rosa chinensis TaxID=74649 RepID=A0A2P6QWW9_ROSCH|nr:hypothetical protein RchiOBHm_Chr4g0416701 [Rosa chinensis]